MPNTIGTSSAAPSLVPQYVQDLFGEPPLLRGENGSVYGTLMEHFAKLIKPADIIEWWWAKDMTDHTWEIRRLRRFKILVVELARDRRFDQDETHAILAEAHGVEIAVSVADSEKDSADFFFYHLDKYRGIDKLIASAELRRDRTLREIERHREHLAERLRKASDEIVKDDVAELPRAA